ncbi:AP endonuclease [Streptomyces sp. TRM 70351]|uniref:AP endonuclease n=1 Tax=Streptomyces sp. TRM 70351 TaxID=3116552 RepID=UPI002E7B8520|nr:AP endonuclease [Streptomyces sp. TRM 70351]MEE1930662.1 AP endonuclease [Streptomyces sp. TRM 70351]
MDWTCGRVVVRAVSRCARQLAPVTGVTANLDLADLFTADEEARARARTELERLDAAGVMLGAGWVRLLGRTVPWGRLFQAMHGGELPEAELPLLVELHHPDWLEPAALNALEVLLERWPRLRLLADTAQLAAAVPSAGPGADAALQRVLGFARVVHLSDDGFGLDTAGHRMVAARAAQRIAGGHGIELAVEWTGRRRTAQACLERYRSACRWWAEYGSTSPARP